MTLNEFVTILGEGTIMVLVTLAVYGIVISMVGTWTLLGNFLYVFGLMPPFISPSEYETEYDMMTFREIH